MKKKIFESMKMLFAVTVVTMAFAACGNDDPVPPTNEPENKLHDEPAKMVVTLVECHLHGDWSAIPTVGGPHQNPDSPAKYIKSTQEMTYLIDNQGKFTLSSNSIDHFNVIKNGEYWSKNGDNNKFEPAPVYLLFIHYYNLKGEDITSQFAKDGQDKIHQHFFTVENVKPMTQGVVEEGDAETVNLIDYLYCDTDPYEGTLRGKDAKGVGTENPIGLKGIVRFLRDRKSFDLRIRLFHGYEGKYATSTGKVSPFYRPDNKLIQRGTWDVDVKFPVMIYWDRNKDGLESIDETWEDLSIVKESDLTPQEVLSVKSVMEAYRLDWSTAIREIVTSTYEKKGHDTASLWL